MDCFGELCSCFGWESRGILTELFGRHARTHLPKYAVPIFIRVVHQMTPIHNNKQNKVPLREEGVDPSKVEKSAERILWIRGDRYVQFQRSDWENLEMEKAML